MNISRLSDDRVLISLCHDDMKNFELDFDTITLKSPHSKRILLRLMTLALSSAGLNTTNKSVMLEALENNEGCLILVSLSDKKQHRKKYRIKRISEFPCFRFECCDDMIDAIKTLYNTDMLFYNNCAYTYNNRYYLVFNYPVVSQKARKILCEYSHSIKCTKPFAAKLNEHGKILSNGNAIVHIGSSL